MKIALKYGLLITAVVVAWIVIVRLLMGVGANPKANLIAAILFNVAEIVAILLGMKARKKELNGKLSFKEGLKTGMGISLVYAISERGRPTGWPNVANSGYGLCWIILWLNFIRTHLFDDNLFLHCPATAPRFQ